MVIPRRMNRHRKRILASAVALAMAVAGAMQAEASDSGGTRMRRARQALSLSDDPTAAIELEAVRRDGPATTRGLEAAMLLADLELRRGRPVRAKQILAEAARVAQSSFTLQAIGIARGWLAVTQGDGTAARRHFREAEEERGDQDHGLVTTLGLAWAELLRSSGTGPEKELLRLISEAPHPGLRFAAGWTAARLHQARGEPKLAEKRLRETRRRVRGTTYEDDALLSLGLAQLASGKPRMARATFRRLARLFGDPSISSAPPLLSLDDLRQSPARLTRQLGELYAARNPASIQILRFLDLAFDRRAADDVPLALELAAAALRNEKGKR